MTDPDDYLYDGTGSDPEVEALERTLGVYAHREPLREPPRDTVPLFPPRRRVVRGFVIATSVIAAAAVVALLIRGQLGREAGDPADRSIGATGGMAFAVEQGTTSCDGKPATTGTLGIGQWLETASDAIATVHVSTIGTLTVFGDTKLRVVETSDRAQRVELAAGKIAARVTAPPRLFIVDTPAATAVDLGCAYELSVDDRGTTRLTVTSGAVSLEGRDGTAWVPRGTSVTARQGRGAGLPIATDARPEIRAAVERFDSGDTSAVRAILEAATAADMVTLWHLISRTALPDRADVVHLLETFVTRPFDHDTDAMIAAQPDALEAWREEVAWEWLLR